MPHKILLQTQKEMTAPTVMVMMAKNSKNNLDHREQHFYEKRSLGKALITEISRYFYATSTLFVDRNDLIWIMDHVYGFPLPTNFPPGHMVRIRGSVPKNGKRFDVNFQLGTEYQKFDIACHLSVRYGEGSILEANSYDVVKRWIRPVHSNLPIRPGTNFDILVLCHSDQFKVAVNGRHFMDFNHRIPFAKIAHVDIRGQLIATSISFECNIQQRLDMIGGSYPFTSF